MVKISFHPVAGQKSDKEEADGEAPAVLISQPHVRYSLVTHTHTHTEARFVSDGALCRPAKNVPSPRNKLYKMIA